MLIRHCKGVYWGYDISSRKYASYAQPILKKDGIKVELNPKLILEVLAKKVIEGRAKDTALTDLYKTWKNFFD